jgi:hypothetical protein
VAKRSMYTDIVLQVIDEIQQHSAEAKKSREVPFMEEKLAPREMRKRMASLPEAQKRAMIDKVGVDQFLKLVGGK